MARSRLKVKRSGSGRQQRPQLKAVTGVPVVKGTDIALDFKSMGLLDGTDGDNGDGRRDSAQPPASGRKARGGLAGYSDIASGAVSREMTSERELRASYAQTLGEWVSGGSSGPGAQTVLYGPDAATGADEVDGSYLHRVDFAKWFRELSRESRGLRLITTGQAVVDLALELAGFFDEKRALCTVELLGDAGAPRLLDSFSDAVDVLYKGIGFMSARKTEQGALELDIDVPKLFAAFQTLCAYALSSCGCNHELVAITRSLDHALVDAVARAEAAESKLKAAEGKLCRTKAALNDRPTKGELRRALRRIGELEAELGELRLKQEEQVAAEPQPEPAAGRSAANPALAAMARAQIDALVRSQTETEKRALLAESELGEVHSALDEAERRNSEAQRIHEAEVRSLKQALAAAGRPRDDGAATALLASAVVELPQTACGVLELAARAFVDKLVVTDSAYGSAEGYKGDPFEIWTLMRALATDGWDLFLGDGGFDVRSEFRSRTGIELSTKEPSLNTKDGRSAWETVYNGKPYSLCNHIKGSKRKNFDSLRIHFAVDRDDKVLIVAHCGDHLPSGGTRRRGW